MARSKGVAYFHLKIHGQKNIMAEGLIRVAGRGLIAIVSMARNGLSQANVPRKGSTVRINKKDYKLVDIEARRRGYRDEWADRIGMNIAPLTKQP